MKKKRSKKFWIILGIILLIIIIGISQNQEDFESDNKTQDQSTETTNDNQDVTIPTIIEEKEEEIPTCDGTTIVKDCEVEGIIYSIYKYYPAEEEKYHYETVTTYERKITGYCTLCNDGTYSPSCATGRGACSHHGGVREWNAPVYSEVPKQEQKKVIDSPAVPERWEKVVKEQ